MRLDKKLFEDRFVDSRNKASELIKNGKVLVNNKVITKPSFVVLLDDNIEIDSKIYVSRGAWKLKYFLEDITYDVSGLECLDIGSSTGGFTEILLQNGATRVTCVDVGHEQLHKSLRGLDSVDVYEGMDIRDFEIDKKFDLLVCDVSFISLSKIIDKLTQLAKKDMILLFKPQFEVGKESKRTRKGVLKNIKDVENAFVKFEQELEDNTLEIVASKSSRISGKEGNIEQFYFVNRP